MTLAPSPYPDNTDLRPAIISRGLKTFHLAGSERTVAGCGQTLDVRAVPDAATKRGALRRGLNLCPQCARLELDELTGLDDEAVE
jgi:hypothetical protein